MSLYYNPDFLRRLGFFLIGTVIGTYFLIKFLDKKDAEFNYFGDARVLKSIRLKPHFVYSDKVKEIMSQHNIDTTAVKGLLYDGDVILNSSNRGNQKCNTYLIEPTEKTAKISIQVMRCDSVATVVELTIKSPK